MTPNTLIPDSQHIIFVGFHFKWTGFYAVFTFVLNLIPNYLHLKYTCRSQTHSCFSDNSLHTCPSFEQ